MVDAKQFIWEGNPLRIDRVLTQHRVARSRVVAAELIAQGFIFVNGKQVKKSSLKVLSGQKVIAKNTSHDVGRGAQKLRAALNAFNIDPHGYTVLDVGASTGGFTQVVLERGAAAVIALDVGHDQLADELKEDRRVINIEGFNARYLNVETLSHALKITSCEAVIINLIVADVSFISITQLLEGFKKISTPQTKIIILVKPQFEVGAKNIGDGVVTNKNLQVEAIKKVIEKAQQLGLFVNNIINSPVLGSLGNREFLMLLESQTSKFEENLGEHLERLFSDGSFA